MYFGGEMPLEKAEKEEEEGRERDADTSGVEASFALLMRWLHRRQEFHPGNAEG